MKKITIFLALIMLYASSFAQTKEEINSMSRKIENVSCVVQGEIIDVELYPGDKNGNRIPNEKADWTSGIGEFYQNDGADAIGYSSAKIKVCKVYKGNVTPLDTIEIVSYSQSLKICLYEHEGKEYLNHTILGMAAPSSWIYYEKDIGENDIFFLNKSKLVSTSFSEIGTPNRIWVSTDKDNFYASWVGELSKDIVVYSEEELDNFLSQFSTLKANPENHCSPVSVLEKKSDGLKYPLQKEEKAKIDYEKNLKNHNEWLERNQERKRNKNTSTKSVQSFGLNLEIANPELSGPIGDTWLEFDILASATSTTTYFDNCLMRIKYNSAAFGTNVFDNNNVQITRGAEFDNSTYIVPMDYVVDWGTDILGIPFGLEYSASSFYRTNLTMIPKNLLHIKIKINQCSEFSNINYTDIEFTDMFSYYTIYPNDDITAGIPYDNTNYSGYINDKMCEPVITNFTDSVPAGIGKILTIEGRYFGNEIGSDGDVIFKDANYGRRYPKINAATYIGVDAYDIVSWSDNTIEIRLPYLFEQVSVATGKQPTPGSGKFIVKNKYGYNIESNTELIVPYAVYQYIENKPWIPIYEKYNVPIANVNDSGGYTIHPTNNLVSTYPNARGVIEKAVHDWSCASGINWEVGDSTNLTPENDGVCIIDANSSSDGLQATYHDFEACPDGDTIKWYLKSFDIEINTSYNWQVDTSGNIQPGMYDFYHAMAHELGHGHLLGHANDSLYGIMFYGAWAGAYPESDRKTVMNDYDAIVGARYIVDSLSDSIPDCGYPSHIISVPQYCQGLYVRENIKGKIELNIFPNPVSSGSITIDYVSDRHSSTHFQLFNSMGQNIRNYNIGTVKEVKQDIPVDNLQNGIYFVRVISNNEAKSVKFIVQH